MLFFYFLYFLFSIMIQGTGVGVPLVLGMVLPLLILRRYAYVFLIAYLSGVILDVMLLRPFGLTGLYFVTTFFLVLLYDRKFEINSARFVVVASFLGSVGYMIIFRGQGLLLGSVLMSLITYLVYTILREILPSGM